MICWTTCICMDFLQVAAVKFLFMNIGRGNVISYHISIVPGNYTLGYCTDVMCVVSFNQPNVCSVWYAACVPEVTCNKKLYMSQQIVRTILQKMTCELCAWLHAYTINPNGDYIPAAKVKSMHASGIRLA